jgi:hypothetical protein
MIADVVARANSWRRVRQSRLVIGDWHRLAACRDHPESVFFSAAGSAQELALLVCASCPVRDCCAVETAHDERDGRVFGVRAGMTETQRRQRVR